ncbi:hypothetical protein pb186bvf_001801 [Paramecium bursaria]
MMKILRELALNQSILIKQYVETLWHGYFFMNVMILRGNLLDAPQNVLRPRHGIIVKKLDQQTLSFQEQIQIEIMRQLFFI